MADEFKCDGCDNCNGCNNCNSCNIVIGLCNTAQKASEHLNEFKWGWCKNNITQPSRAGLEKDNTFFTKTEWDSLINYIEEAHKLGTEHNAIDTYNNVYTEKIKTDDNIVMTATMYNEAYRRMKNLALDDRTQTYNIVKKNDIITAKVFNDLRQLANSFNLHTYQCNSCNACNNCLTCNSCDSCEGDYVNIGCCYTPPPSPGGGSTGGGGGGCLDSCTGYLN